MRARLTCVACVACASACVQGFESAECGRVVLFGGDTDQDNKLLDGTWILE